VSQLPAVIEPAPLPALPEITDADVTEAWLGQLSPHTRRAYGGDLRRFAAHLGLSDTHRAVAIILAGGPGVANRAAISWRSAMEAAGLSAATVARRLSALRSVVDLAGSLGRITWSLTVRAPKVLTYRDVRGPGRAGWRAVVAQLGGAGPLAARDLAVARLLHDLMLRRSEVVGLDVEHLEIEGGKPAAVWILGKGRTSRERLQLAPPTAAALETWLRHRGPEVGPLFTRLDIPMVVPLPRLSDRSVAKIVGRAGRRAGLDRPVRPHGLRHEGITRAIEMDQSLLDVQLAARHRDPRTTQRYVDRVRDPQPRISRLIAED
jgi:integrase/recombinase XerC